MSTYTVTESGPNGPITRVSLDGDLSVKVGGIRYTATELYGDLWIYCDHDEEGLDLSGEDIRKAFWEEHSLFLPALDPSAWSVSTGGTQYGRQISAESIQWAERIQDAAVAAAESYVYDSPNGLDDPDYAGTPSDGWISTAWQIDTEEDGVLAGIGDDDGDWGQYAAAVRREVTRIRAEDLPGPDGLYRVVDDGYGHFPDPVTLGAFLDAAARDSSSNEPPKLRAMQGGAEYWDLYPAEHWRAGEPRTCVLRLVNSD